MSVFGCCVWLKIDVCKMEFVRIGDVCFYDFRNRAKSDIIRGGWMQDSECNWDQKSGLEIVIKNKNLDYASSFNQ